MRGRRGMGWVATLLIAVFIPCAFSDTITLTGGGVIEGIVLQENEKNVVIRYGTGILTLPRSAIRSIQRTPTIKPPPTISTQPIGRIPSGDLIIERLVAQPWAVDFRQIPATVIDVGVLRSVPYKSYRCGSGNNYEVNVYGDPADPAGFEIGIYNSLINDPTARRHCIDFITSLLPDRVDRDLIAVIDHEEDAVERDGIMFEFTPPTAEDAYGGWWLSVYNTEKLDSMRATAAELAEITVPREPQAPAPRPSPPSRTPVRVSPPPPLASEKYGDWSADDFRYARPDKAVTGGSGIGRVYVRGYYRKDGTYVRPHTRSR